jgi:anaerobic ribonucleoside-triphosphate reductase activating protein
MALKYVNTGIVFQEIPDEVTLAVNISGCPCRCPGCHSKYLWEDVGIPLYADAIDAFVEKYGNDITCIAFIGGDGDPVGVNMLAQYIHENHPLYHVAWYSGRLRIPAKICKTDFDYIKIGPYIKHLGPLNSPTTNQRIYRQSYDGTFEDITSRFWTRHHPSSAIAS